MENANINVKNNSIGIHPKGSNLFVGMSNGKIQMIDMRTKTIRCEI